MKNAHYTDKMSRHVFRRVIDFTVDRLPVLQEWVEWIDTSCHSTYMYSKEQQT